MFGGEEVVHGQFSQDDGRGYRRAGDSPPPFPITTVVSRLSSIGRPAKSRPPDPTIRSCNEGLKDSLPPLGSKATVSVETSYWAEVILTGLSSLVPYFLSLPGCVRT